MSVSLKRGTAIFAAVCMFFCLVLPFRAVYAAEVQDGAEIPVRSVVENLPEAEADSFVFQFEIAADEEGSPMPENTSISITGEGTESFIIPYDRTQPGIYSYIIRQVPGERTDVTCDREVYQVKLQVIEDNGLQTVVSIRTASTNEKTDEAEFRNSVNKPSSDSEEDPKDESKENPKNDPEKKEPAKSSSEKQGSKAAAAESAKTDDSSNLYFWMAAGVTALLMMGAVIRRRRLARADEESAR
ncbi:MAG: FctA domain-containing protein [Lachnospiraceae bacterium]|nr:FctA domain-containing protein [Lachnospiraceae bacterium]